MMFTRETKGGEFLFSTLRTFGQKSQMISLHQEPYERKKHETDS